MLLELVGIIAAVLFIILRKNMESVVLDFNSLRNNIAGELFTDDLHKSIYATDASVYRMIPLGVCYPKSNNDLKLLVAFAQENKITLIPRTAGTSLAGQCVGEGLVVDVSKYFTEIISLDETKKTITVQPGVIRDELNRYLKSYGLFFGPNTSTSNRCMVGGMVGNNSSGTTSIKFGVTRDKVVALDVILSDGAEVSFASIDKKTFEEKRKGDDLESKIYQSIYNELSNVETQQEINAEFPDKSIHRRNNGYAVDALLSYSEFGGTDDTINIASLLTGSEGTLALTTAITLQLDELPPAKNVMVAAHFNSIQESLEAVVIAMKHNLYTCELMDKTILDCTKDNRAQAQNRFFIEEDPAAILMLEICTNDDTISEKLADALVEDLKAKGFGYAYPKLFNEDINKALELRKAGLGLLGNIIGDDKAVACIEDTAVQVQDLPNYIGEFTKMMTEFGQEAVYYAHAGAGEIHLRPILNLKKEKDVVLFREITTKTAHLVKKYGGSFSGEHGDGIVRAEFIPLMIGDKNYQLIKRIKHVFDANSIFNKGKITDPFPMDQALRFVPDRQEPEVDTILDFSDSLGILRATEKCNGSGDCRKLPDAGGTLCPSYRATRNEKDTTRARANALREYLTNSNKDNKFNHQELYDVFDLCLSCKACASECPSNVDVANLKAEFLYQYYKTNPVPFRSKMMAANAKWNKLGSITPRFSNFMLKSNVVKNFMGIAKERSIPKLANTTVFKWYKKQRFQPEGTKGILYLFVDEFTNYYDANVGIDTIELLTKLGYEVKITKHRESGRGYLSKGLLDEAKELANFNVNHFKTLISETSPLVGIEPSAILTFKDEYLRLADDKEAARAISAHTFTIEEFIAKEIATGNISSASFTNTSNLVKVHGHCHQKSMGTMLPVQQMLSLPENYNVTIINSGCCGMAGSFGYEKEHYKVSMQVGEDTLFPKIRKTEASTLIAASGTSCRHQIKDGASRDSQHPVSILRKALL